MRWKMEREQKEKAKKEVGGKVTTVGKSDGKQKAEEDPMKAQPDKKAQEIESKKEEEISGMGEALRTRRQQIILNQIEKEKKEKEKNERWVE